MRLVPDDGPTNAKLVIIGESPGKWEDIKLKPFVGPAGELLGRWLSEAGLRRDQSYVTNVVPWRPANNKIETVPKAELEHWTVELHRRLAALDDPWVLVPTGNTAVRALTGKNQGITQLRGSIYDYKDLNGRPIKVIPTIHPAAVFREPGLERRCRLDWKRIAGDLSFRELRLPSREHIIHPTIDHLRWFEQEVEHAWKTQGPDAALSLDIETPRESRLVEVVSTKLKKDGTPSRRKPKVVLGEPRIVCIGVSVESHTSLTIPTTERYWGHADDLEAAWATLRRLAQHAIPKVTHNGLFDAYYLAQDHAIRLAMWRWDTLALHHALCPNEDHSLAYLASILTREPYWKDEAKDPDEASKYTSNMEAFYMYNGKDACVTRELLDVLRSALHEAV